jgi:hypothetical protein
MCSTGNKVGSWQTSLPQEKGDWLWLAVWSGCGCVRKSGVAWVQEVEEPFDPKNAYWQMFWVYVLPSGKRMAISWEGQKPDFYEEQPDIDWWQKIDLPPPLDDFVSGPSNGAAT